MEEGDFSQGRELSVIIVTSLGIFKKTVESIKEIKRAKTKIRMERMVQLQLYSMVVLILYVRIPLGLQIQQLFTMLHPNVIFSYFTLLVTLVKLG
jgi:hypothetical protein